uniref:Secreted protein n=1 Tax=Picea glauca TaxID=3330 RepID=A0A124GPA5_PICGL|nr:hypothetical protein ABT39_MTgene1199 [Picea glauca]QHR86726.1 hypothetical protein Q903MT_gene730 [Picea sitchensis]
MAGILTWCTWLQWVILGNGCLLPPHDGALFSNVWWKLVSITISSGNNLNSLSSSGGKSFSRCMVSIRYR